MGCVFFLNRNMNTFYWNQWNNKRFPNVYVIAPDSNTFYAYLLFMLFKQIYATYSISKTILKNFYHYNQTYKYNATDKVWDNLLIEPAFKHCICK
jgi:plasmid replication initiation protein